MLEANETLSIIMSNRIKLRMVSISKGVIADMQVLTGDNETGIRIRL